MYVNLCLAYTISYVGYLKDLCWGPSFLPFTFYRWVISLDVTGLLSTYRPTINKYCSFDLSDSKNKKSRIENCIADIRLWMITQKRKLNDDKTEIIILLAPSHTTQIQIQNNPPLRRFLYLKIAPLIKDLFTNLTLTFLCSNLLLFCTTISCIGMLKAF